MSEIKPALTAKEWERTPLGEPLQLEEAAIVSRRGVPVVELYDQNRHRVAARCLHCQPFGFTWEDVDLIREVQFRNESEADELGALAYSLANRIAALLPPREG